MRSSSSAGAVAVVSVGVGAALAAFSGCSSTPTTVVAHASASASASAAPSASVSAAVVLAPRDPHWPALAEKRPVTEDYHGVKVTDDYRWLENSGDPAVRSWSNAHNDYTRRVLAALPGRDAIKAKLSKLLPSISPDWYRLEYCGGKLFAAKSEPPLQQPSITVVRVPTSASLSSPLVEKTVIGPGAIGATGNTTLDWYRASPDGKYVAVSLSSGGSESGTLYVFETDTSKRREIDTIPRVNGGTAGGSVAWTKDATGFYYTRYPSPGERPAEDLAFYQQVYFHKLGADPKTDTPSLTDGIPRIGEIALETSPDGKWLLASIANGDGGEFEQWILSLGPKTKINTWRKFAAISDAVIEAHFAPDGELYVRSRHDASKGKILKMAPDAELSTATLVVPEGDAVIDAFIVTKNRIYVSDLVGGPYDVRVFDRGGAARDPLPIPKATTVWGLEALVGDDVVVRTDSYLKPGTWNLYTDKDGHFGATPLARKPTADFDDIEVEDDTCISKDSTKVPVRILHKKGIKLDGSHPMLMTGYGGFSLPESPSYDPSLRVWFDADGVFADTNLRGGSEFGEAWHQDGALTKKQHVFDDFIACAKHLIDKGYTSPAHFGIIGGSNGGLLMGAALTQAPELFRAVVSMVGIYDMLRVETTPNGAFNIPEFGTVTDEAQFKAMLAYSPFHNVHDGARYPSVLFTTGANDPRVDPYHSRKMVARLEAAEPDGIFLLRANDNTGHGSGTSLDERVEAASDMYAFLFSELGISEHAIGHGEPFRGIDPATGH